MPFIFVITNMINRKKKDEIVIDKINKINKVNKISKINKIN